MVKPEKNIDFLKLECYCIHKLDYRGTLGDERQLLNVVSGARPWITPPGKGGERDEMGKGAVVVSVG